MASSILIVDPKRSFADRLRINLVRYGTKTHVFASHKAALRLLATKKVDSVVVPFGAGRETIEFCEIVQKMHVSLVFVSDDPIEAVIDPCWSAGGTHACARF